MAGRLAALKLCPSASNLDGTRLAAERIVQGVEGILREKCRLMHGSSHGARHREEAEELLAYAAGTRNMFGSLTEASS